MHVTGNIDDFFPSWAQQRKLALDEQMQIRQIAVSSIRRNGETQSLCFDLRSQFLLFVRVDARARQRAKFPLTPMMSLLHTSRF